ncbi:MAG: hypothetical protein MUP09_06325 [Thiovulaceae bacterium]|nr:hypothetical protein [Sulfurimonadaceae bacterium]
MWIKITKDGSSDDYERKSRWIGSIFIIIGLIVSVYSIFSTLSTDTILGVALTSVGIISAYLTAKINPHTYASWRKALLIFFSGLIFLFFSISDSSTIAYFIGSFFFLNTLNNIYFAYLTRPDATAYAWAINSLVSALFAFIILSSTATISANGIGLFVALSLIAEGLTLFYLGRKIYIRP